MTDMTGCDIVVTDETRVTASGREHRATQGRTEPTQGLLPAVPRGPAGRQLLRVASLPERAPNGRFPPKAAFKGAVVVRPSRWSAKAIPSSAALRRLVQSVEAGLSRTLAVAPRLTLTCGGGPLLFRSRLEHVAFNHSHMGPVLSPG